MPAMPDPVQSDCPDLVLTCRLANLGAVTLEPVGDAERVLWRAMMASHHPEGWSRMPVRYWVRSSVHGRLGGIGFAAASWHQKARDDFIGWSAQARVANLGHVVNNDRFLLLPGVRVDSLASHALALTTARLGGNWEAAHGVRPLVAYSYVGPDRPGTGLPAGSVVPRGLRDVRRGAARWRRERYGSSRWLRSGARPCAGNRTAGSVRRRPRTCWRMRTGPTSSTGAVPIPMAVCATGW